MSVESMIEAIKADDVAEVRRLQSLHGFSGVESYYRDRTSIYIFPCAVARGNPEIVAMFLEGDRYERILPEKHLYCLMEAVRRNQHEIAALLTAHGFSPTVKDGYGNSPLGLAHRKGDEAMVRALTANGPIPSAAWKILEHDRIAHVAHDAAIGYRITTIFNFATRQCVTITRNLEKDVERHDVRHFGEIDDKTAIITAAEELCRLGGVVDAQAVGYSPVSKKRQLLIEQK